MLVEIDTLTFPITHVGLLIEQGCGDRCLGLRKLLLSERFTSLRVQTEVEDLVPAWHCSLVGVGPVDFRVVLVVLDLDLNVCFDLRSFVQFLLRLNTATLAIFFDLFFPIIVRITRQVGGHVCSWSMGTTKPGSVTRWVIDLSILFDNIGTDWDIFSFNYVHNDLALAESL